MFDAHQGDKGPRFTGTFGIMGFFKPPRLPFEEQPRVVTPHDLERFRHHVGGSLAALSRLQELDLSACPKLTDGSITQVGVVAEARWRVAPPPHSPRPVLISASPGLSPQVVQQPDLQRLSLSMLSHISDASLVSVARRCRCLSSLALSHCPRISDRGIAQAAPCLRRLQHLYLSCCDNVTDRKSVV